MTYKISESECNTFVTQIQHIAIKTGNHKNNVKYNRFYWVFCLYIKLYAYICNVFFMVLELRLTKIGCRDDNQFFHFKLFRFSSILTLI